MAQLVALTRGKFTVVDYEDYERVARLLWVAMPGSQGNWYGCRGIKSAEGKRTMLYLHRFILDAPEGLLVDHINGDGLDNRRANLRLANTSQNAINRRFYTPASGFRGVYLESGRFRARIWFDHGRQSRSLGYYETAIEAAVAYDEAARRIHGAFAQLNFQDGEAA